MKKKKKEQVEEEKAAKNNNACFLHQQVIEWKKNRPKWLEFIGCVCTQFKFVRFAFSLSLFLVMAANEYLE